ncbi:MAG: DUF433 domain-containing protein [Acidimicrobiales bacterium]
MRLSSTTLVADASAGNALEVAAAAGAGQQGLLHRSPRSGRGHFSSRQEASPASPPTRWHHYSGETGVERKALTAPTIPHPDYGLGIYSFPTAAHLLRRRGTQVTVRQLRYWMDSGLTSPSFGRDTSGSAVLSFADLISLEVVRRFLAAGVSLQAVRRAERAMREWFVRPFAHQRFFTDGSSIWCQVNPADDSVLEIRGRRLQHLAWTPAIATFASEIRYEDGVAARWGLGQWVEMDPKVRFGAPVVKGTRVPVSTIAAELEAASVDEVADWHGLRVEQVVGVRDYLAA